MDRKHERAKEALQEALLMIRELHKPTTDDQREIRKIASGMAQARGLNPESVVAFSDQADTTVLVDAQGRMALSVDAEKATWVPAWKLFEADARTARDAIKPPQQTVQQQQAASLAKALKRDDRGMMMDPRQVCDVD